MTNTFGMEFEFEGLSPRDASYAINDAGIQCDVIRDGIHDTHDEWKAVYDGSLNNGAEVVSPILTAERLNEAHRVTSALSKAGARTSTTAGYHVHLGVNAFVDENSLALFVLNYYASHHAIGALVSPSRMRNRFCRILGRDEAEQVAEWVRDGNSGTRNGDRYTSLNLESMNRHHTVEIRLHQSTLNGVKAIAWAQLMEALLKVSNAGISLEDIGELNAWAPVNMRQGLRDVNACNVLLDVLALNNKLSASTADWLKNRAKVLNK